MQVTYLSQWQMNALDKMKGRFLRSDQIAPSQHECFQHQYQHRLLKIVSPSECVMISLVWNLWNIHYWILLKIFGDKQKNNLQPWTWSHPPMQEYWYYIHRLAHKNVFRKQQSSLSTLNNCRCSFFWNESNINKVYSRCLSKY